ncbi:MAG: hypothetical protein GF364_02885, partial [Candidatus Lokiarchaeota archaeon]|nr:hypothetical protein [Candidatus Lokiarchaeota archaeon]
MSLIKSINKFGRYIFSTEEHGFWKVYSFNDSGTLSLIKDYSNTVSKIYTCPFGTLAVKNELTAEGGREIEVISDYIGNKTFVIFVDSAAVDNNRDKEILGSWHIFDQSNITDMAILPNVPWGLLVKYNNEWIIWSLQSNAPADILSSSSIQSESSESSGQSREEWDEPASDVTSDPAIPPEPYPPESESSDSSASEGEPSRTYFMDSSSLSLFIKISLQSISHDTINTFIYIDMSPGLSRYFLYIDVNNKLKEGLCDILYWDYVTTDLIKDDYSAIENSDNTIMFRYGNVSPDGINDNRDVLKCYPESKYVGMMPVIYLVYR